MLIGKRHKCSQGSAKNVVEVVAIELQQSGDEGGHERKNTLFWLSLFRSVARIGHATLTKGRKGGLGSYVHCRSVIRSIGAHV